MLIASNALAFSYFARYTLPACDVGEQTRGRKVTGSVFVFSWYKILLLSTFFTKEVSQANRFWDCTMASAHTRRWNGFLFVQYFWFVIIRLVCLSEMFSRISIICYANTHKRNNANGNIPHFANFCIKQQHFFVKGGMCACGLSWDLGL